MAWKNLRHNFWEDKDTLPPQTETWTGINSGCGSGTFLQAHNHESQSARPHLHETTSKSMCNTKKNNEFLDFVRDGRKHRGPGWWWPEGLKRGDKNTAHGCPLGGCEGARMCWHHFPPKRKGMESTHVCGGGEWSMHEAHNWQQRNHTPQRQHFMRTWKKHKANTAHIRSHTNAGE